MSEVFDAYARYYDLLYADKDYAAEAQYVDSHIREHLPNAGRILELGSGTGAHAEHFARMGYSVHGIDQSEKMLVRASERKASLPPDIAERMTFGGGDVRSVRTGEHYDAVVSLFHVISYLPRNSDLDAAFATAAAHLRSGGLFFFDFWYGPAVLAQKPESRVKRLEDKDIRVTRTARPHLRVNENVVDVDYSVAIEVKVTGQVDDIRETHRMRYLFLPEIARLAVPATWSEPKAFAWMKRDALDESVWSGCALAIRR
ncbi:MAG: class I SAM-dependent DNA methyltransferase [Woeseiaceae bacterium]